MRAAPGCRTSMHTIHERNEACSLGVRIVRDHIKGTQPATGTTPVNRMLAITISIIAAVFMTVAMHPLTWATLEEGAAWLKPTLDNGATGLVGPGRPHPPFPGAVSDLQDDRPCRRLESRQARRPAHLLVEALRLQIHQVHVEVGGRPGQRARLRRSPRLQGLRTTPAKSRAPSSEASSSRPAGAVVGLFANSRTRFIQQVAVHFKDGRKVLLEGKAKDVKLILNHPNVAACLLAAH